VHAFWDHHRDWARRVEAPFIVGDMEGSLVLAEPLAYEDLLGGCPDLHSPAELQRGLGQYTSHKLTARAVRFLDEAMRTRP
jgi:hypothetical protein